MLAFHVYTWRKFTGFIGGGAIVCFFFFITAIFTKPQDWALVFKKSLRLAIPYLVWCILLAYCYAFASQKAMPDWTSWSCISKKLGLGLAFEGGPLWFLRALILLVLLNPILSRLNLYSLITVVLLSLAGVVCTWFDSGIINICSNVDACLLYWSLFAFSLGVITRKYVGLTKFLTFCDKYGFILFTAGVALLLFERMIILKFTAFSYVSTYATAIFAFPAACIVFAKYFPLLTKKMNILAPAMFFVFASQPFSITAVNFCNNLIIEKGYPALAEIFLGLAPFPMLALGCAIYFLLERCKIFDGWLLIKH